MRHVKNSIYLAFRPLLPILLHFAKAVLRCRMGGSDPMKDKRVALYVRVSTGEQNLDSQLTELTDYANFRKWGIVEAYSDKMSGAKDRRPELDRLMADAR